jgi:hypothetical protein
MNGAGLYVRSGAGLGVDRRRVMAARYRRSSRWCVKTSSRTCGIQGDRDLTAIQRNSAVSKAIG